MKQETEKKKKTIPHITSGEPRGKSQRPRTGTSSRRETLDHYVNLLQ